MRSKRYLMTEIPENIYFSDVTDCFSLKDNNLTTPQLLSVLLERCTWLLR